LPFFLPFSRANTLANIEADTEADSERDSLKNTEADNEAAGLGASLVSILADGPAFILAAFQASSEAASRRFSEALCLGNSQRKGLAGRRSRLSTPLGIRSKRNLSHNALTH